MAPIQKPGRSKQDYGTPDDFLAAVFRRFLLTAYGVGTGRNGRARWFTVWERIL